MRRLPILASLAVLAFLATAMPGPSRAAIATGETATGKPHIKNQFRKCVKRARLSRRHSVERVRRCRAAMLRAQLGAVSPRFFSPSSFWNAPLADNHPIDRRSPELVRELGRIASKLAAAHDGPWIASRQYSSPVYTVPAGQPRVRVKLDVQEASNMQGAFSAVPVPRNARPADGLDQHLTIWQPSTDTLWEFWKAQHRADGWHARWGGGMKKVSQSPGVFDADSWPGAKPWWGATGSSLPLVGGMITLAELRARKIQHGLAFALPAIRKGFYSRPAQRTDGRDPRSEAIPMGTRFRIDPRLDLNTLDLPPATRMIAEAIQRYGMVLRDTSSTMQFYAEDFNPSGRNPFPELFGRDYPNNYWRQLAKLPWDRMRVLKLDLRHQGS